ncbi:MAG TPA: hypothetical protein VF635_07115, partial [Propionibacteriaceae bacterium]
LGNEPEASVGLMLLAGSCSAQTSACPNLRYWDHGEPSTLHRWAEDAILTQPVSQPEKDVTSPVSTVCHHHTPS